MALAVSFLGVSTVTTEIKSLNKKAKYQNGKKTDDQGEFCQRVKLCFCLLHHDPFLRMKLFLTLVTVYLKAYLLNCRCLGPQNRNLFFSTIKGKDSQNE